METVCENNEKINELMTNPNYMEWIIEFTKERNGFTDKPDKALKKKDRDMIALFPLFYQGIENYAKNNYIYASQCDFGTYYNVKYNDFGFKFGNIPGKDSTFFCIKREITQEEDFIDFSAVLSGKEPMRTHCINYALTDLIGSIIDAYQDEVPLVALKKAINDTLSEITKGKYDLPKMLTKEKDEKKEN